MAHSKTGQVDREFGALIDWGEAAKEPLLTKPRRKEGKPMQPKGNEVKNPTPFKNLKG